MDGGHTRPAQAPGTSSFTMADHRSSSSAGPWGAVQYGVDGGGNNFNLDFLQSISEGGGSFQHLLQAVSWQMPPIAADTLVQTGVGCAGPSGFKVLRGCETLPEIDEDTSGQASGGRVADDSDGHLSGYESSASSVYAVASDDEEYNVSDNSRHDLEMEMNTAERALQGEGNANNCGQHVCAGEQRVGDDQPHCPCMDGNPFMHVITPVNNEADGQWKKRNRTKPNENRPNCRVPKGMGPIEIALRNAPYRKTRYIFEPIIGLTFDSEEEAYEFYNLYSWEVGFGIKRDSTSSNRKTEYQTMRDLRCLCAGGAGGCEFTSKKTGCKAMIRLLRSEDDGWYISRYVAEHNHPFSHTPGQKKQWFSHARLDVRAKDMVRYLRENNVSLTKVHCIIGSMFGSMEGMPSKRSLRSICYQIAKDQMNDDVQKTLSVFRDIRNQDPGFQFSVQLDDENKIKTLLWINGRSRDQYQCFSDVVTFDTTYCTNIYNMPFGLFVGVNNHFQTTIFGGVFMKDEKTDSFKWVFEEFVSLMGGQAPKVVFTDQCAAMASAISSVWADTKHLLCKWHIFKDAPAKLGPIYRKGEAFRKLFHKIINDMLTIDEFERAWDYMLERFALRDNAYLRGIYDKREQWAKAFFKDIFCARMSSTQRSESANHMLKRFVPRNCSMNRFVLQFNKLLYDRNNAEDCAEYDTTIVRNVRKRAWPVEEHAMTIYTSAVYALFRQEVDRSTRYFAIEKVRNEEYEVVHVKPHMKLPWQRERIMVFVIDSGARYQCECGLYEHFGVLCSHVLRVMVQLGVYQIPEAHINKRWTRSARDIMPQGLKSYELGTLCLDSMTYRHRYLYLDAVEIVDGGDKDLGAFDIVSKSFKELKMKLKEYFVAKKNNPTSVLDTDGIPRDNYYTTESEAVPESGSENEAMLVNSYGAAGSCAGMSDSELLGIRAPSFNRRAGRPRQNRFKGALDYFGAKKRKGKEPKYKKKKIRCGECKILGHSAANCRGKAVDLGAGIPKF